MDTASVLTQLRELVSGLDPAELPLSWAERWWSELDAIERVAAGAKTLIADRVAESEVWRRKGFRTPAEHLASVSGSSVTHARAQLATSKRLADLPATAHALRNGELSFSQADAITDAARTNPDTERRLLKLSADGASLGELRDACARAKAAGDKNPDDTWRRLRQQRSLRQYRDADGAWRLSARGTIDDQARFNAALAPIVDELFQETTDDEDVTREQLDYDALVRLVSQPAAETSEEPKRRGKGQARATEFLGLIRIDYEALVRGWTEDDEVAEIAGLGPIPVKRARELLGEAVWRLVITKGVDVANLTYLGRGPNMAQKMALAWAQPICSVLGCNRTRLEHDHRQPWAQVRETRLANIDEHCPHHHRLKTKGWALTNGPNTPMVPPTDPRHPNNQKRPNTAA